MFDPVTRPEDVTLIHNMNISDEGFGNISNASTVDRVEPEQMPQLAMLVLLLVICMSAMGNLLVCLAVIWDRRLQNMTNYFLMSLAIADLLVSLLVMPLGMVVEIYGYFPFDAGVCVFWVAVDVLMCTASIWHMCTMSMDRFFTLKYPMRYGRNKTKMMVVLKIFFVWIVSITICSPIFIFGAKDTANVYNEGLCVPTVAEFVIYGSIFAFYIPLTIMLITYVLTIRILWKNQLLMKNIERSNNYRPRNRYGENRCVIRTLLSPPSDDESRKVSLGNNSDTDATMLAGILSQQDNLDPSTPNQDTIDPQGQYDLPPSSAQGMEPQHSERLITSPFKGESNRSASMSCLEIRVSNPSDEDSCQCDSQTDLLRSKCDSCQSGEQVNLNPKLNMCSCEMQINSGVKPSLCPCGSQTNVMATLDMCKCGSGIKTVKRDRHTDRHTLHCAASFNNMPNLENGMKSSPQRLSETVQFHSCGNLTRDFKFKEWKQHYFQIQREMDQCLKDSCGSPNKEHSSPNKEHSHCSPTKEHSSSNKERSYCVQTRAHSPIKDQTPKERSPRKLSASHGHIPDSGDEDNTYRVYSHSQLTDTGYNTMRQTMYESSIDDMESSSSSEFLTINLNPSSFHMYRLSVPPDATMPLLQKCNGTAVGNGHCVSDDSRRPSTESPEHVYFKRHDPSKKSIKYLLKRFNKSQGMKQILSKKATSNEKKASKVLGIIFAVFVVLWTPFFIVNILSVSCAACMWALTPEMMSVFVWMGYIASLANPIIYTMFNTAFRRTFIRILKCHLCKRGGFRMDSLAISYAAASQLNTDRRNTMTVLLKDDQRREFQSHAVHLLLRKYQ
ncbi:tyramine/octopamine receptor-like [Pecten maximus]|uniref:tyramine/octopamine receptor-like n=1 Tax=Pecten maximus TaxID=6579 RepID=UPI0014586D44|nr:tyramine/octopamine receptor-like [Pecten maximus]